MCVIRTGAVVFVALAAAACASMNNTADRTPPPPGPSPTVVSGSRSNVIPVGQELDVRLQETLSSETAKVETRFQATTVVDMTKDGDVLIPAGSVVRGMVSGVDSASRTDRTGSLTLSFDQLTVRGNEYPINASAVGVFESEGLRGEAPRIGTGAGVGALIGGIVGGLSGALAGAIIGGAGIVAATEGEDVRLPTGTIVRIRMDTPVSLRGR